MGLIAGAIGAKKGRGLPQLPDGPGRGQQPMQWLRPVGTSPKVAELERWWHGAAWADQFRAPGGETPPEALAAE